MKSLLDGLRISFAGLAVGALVLGGVGGCSGSCENDKAAGGDAAVVDDHAGHDHGDEHSDIETADEDGPRIDLYEGILGDLTFVPEAGDTKRHPKIRHVHIPTFKSADGTIPMSRDGYPGMKSMTMEFPLADGVALDGYQAGDKVRFSFEVTWGDSFSWVMTSVEKLDPATEIDYSNTAP